MNIRRIQCRRCMAEMRVDISRLEVSSLRVPDMVTWERMDEHEMSIFTGPCPECGAVTVFSYDSRGVIQVISSVAAPLPSPETVDADERIGTCKTMFRMTCDECGHTFDVAHRKRVCDNRTYATIETVHLQPHKDGYMLPEEWYNIKHGGSREETEYALMPNRIDDAIPENECVGPCPYCKVPYTVVFRYSGRFAAHEVVAKKRVQRMTRLESLRYICSHAGVCEGSVLCPVCSFNNGNIEKSAIFYCDYWGDTRMMDLARHESIGYLERFIAAENELKKLSQ